MRHFTPLAQFDGSVIVERTAGEVSARCHDEEANNLALNLMHEIVTGAKDVPAARNYYAKEFADYRRKKPTPFMDGLRFDPPRDGSTADPDARVLCGFIRHSRVAHVVVLAECALPQRQRMASKLWSG